MQVIDIYSYQPARTEGTAESPIQNLSLGVKLGEVDISWYGLPRKGIVSDHQEASKDTWEKIGDGGGC